MLQVDHVLCLVSAAFPRSAALRHGTEVATRAGAVLHAMSVGANGEVPRPDTLRGQIQTLGSSNSVKIRVGPSVQDTDDRIGVIQQYVEREGIQLLVTDPPPHRGAVPPLADSFLQRLVEDVDVSILFADEEMGPASTDLILVPTDLSNHSFRALLHAAALANALDASILLLHVVEENPYVALTSSDQLSMSTSTLAEHRAHRRLRAFIGESDRLDVPIELHLAFGNPENEIAHFVETHDVDLMVLSSHGTTTELRNPLGHVSDRILRRIPVPVFLVRAFGPSLVGANAE